MARAAEWLVCPGKDLGCTHPERGDLSARAAQTHPNWRTRCLWDLCLGCHMAWVLPTTVQMIFESLSKEFEVDLVGPMCHFPLMSALRSEGTRTSGTAHAGCVHGPRCPPWPGDWFQPEGCFQGHVGHLLKSGFPSERARCHRSSPPALCPQESGQRGLLSHIPPCWCRAATSQARL